MRLFTPLLAASALALGCTACAADEPSDADTAVPATVTSAAATTPEAATLEAAHAFWDAVQGVDDEATGVISQDIGEDFHAMLGKQDTGIGLVTLATGALGWNLEAGFTASAAISDVEATIRAGLEDPASIGEESEDSIRVKAFVRFGSDDSRDAARDLCLTLTEGTRAAFVAAVADAADASRTDAGSPAVTGAGLTSVICPQMTDEYLAALHELADAA